jgi:hypothetical protein
VTRSEPDTDGVALLGWNTRDRALALLQEDCDFDPPLGDAAAEALWARYRERVNRLRGRSLTVPVRGRLTPDEAHVVHEFERDACRQPAAVQEVIKVDPFALVVHQLEITVGRSNAIARRLRTPADWAAECLCPARSAVTPPVRHAPNSVDVDLPHGEWALLFDPRYGLILGEAARCIAVTTVGPHLVLWSGYHRAYAAAARRREGERSVLAAVVNDIAIEPPFASCGLRAIKSDNPPIFADFFNPDLALPVRFRVKRFTMKIRAQVIAENVEASP